jgi:predicted nucleic acid-binding protein
LILVDTSVWIDHQRATDARLIATLRSGQVLAHPFVIGELALGQLRFQQAILAQLQVLPQAVVATHDEVMRLIGQHALAGSGIGYVDVHLLASARLTQGSGLWTRDRRLGAVAARLGVAAT